MISIIIPVHKYNEEISKLLSEALTSVNELKNKENVDIVIVGSDDVLLPIKNDFKNFSIKFVTNTGSTSVQNQINLAVDQISTEWFTVLEFDDNLSINFVDNFVTYKNLSEEISIFTPIIVEINKDGQFIKFTNESCWSRSLNDEQDLGYITDKVLKFTKLCTISGAVINTKDFVEYGKLKTNIDIMFNYELFLRFLQKGKKIFTIPKIGYLHRMDREDSYFGVQLAEKTNEDITKLSALAEAESFFTYERKLED